MKTALIAAHQFSFSEPVGLHNCLGVLALAASLRLHNLECIVPDFYCYHHLAWEPYDEFLNNVVNSILALQCNVIGFSTMSGNLVIALELCREIKFRVPELVTLLGGPGVSFCAPGVLENFPQVDAIIRGEADYALPAFLAGLEGGNRYPEIKGLVYFANNRITDYGWPDPVADLDLLPVPAYDLCSAPVPEADAYGDYNGISLEAGRGCPYSCSFCSTSHFFRHKYRYKSVERLMEEIDYTRKLFGTHRIIFHHDLLTYNPAYIEELCMQIRSRFTGLSWKCHTRLDTINPGILEKMAESGCNELFIGIETATARMQHVTGKELNLADLQPLLDSLDALQYKFSLSFIIGLPREQESDLGALFALAVNIKEDCRDRVVLKIHTLAPLPGSLIFRQWQKHLAYDPYGCIGTTGIPPSWSAAHNLIRKHPEIFSVYFHVRTANPGRSKIVKLALIGFALEKLMPHALRVFAEETAAGFYEAVCSMLDEIGLPVPGDIATENYTAFLEMLYSAALKFLKKHKLPFRRFDGLAKLEMAVHNLTRRHAEKKWEIIHVFCDPAALFNLEPAGSGVERGEQEYFLVVFTDKDAATNTNVIHYLPADRDLVAFIKGSGQTG